MGLFDQSKQGLKKTARLLKTDIRDLFKSRGRLVDDAFLAELFEMLVKTGLGVEPAGETVEDVRTAFRARVVEMDEVLARIEVKFRSLLTTDN
jgi:fused signal recognition particle receptor